MGVLRILERGAVLHSLEHILQYLQQLADFEWALPKAVLFHFLMLRAPGSLSVKKTTDYRLQTINYKLMIEKKDREIQIGW